MRRDLRIRRTGTRLAKVAAAVSPFVLLFSLSAVVHTAPAAADTPPDCVTTPETTTQGCGYYMVENGSSVLAGENSVSPSVITSGTPVVQTATVEAPPVPFTNGGGDAGVYSVSMTSFFGPITSYSPTATPCMSVTVEPSGNQSSVTWAVPVPSDTCPLQPFAQGQQFTLDNTTTGLGAGSAECAPTAGWLSYGQSGSGQRGSSASAYSTCSGGSSSDTPPTAGFTYQIGRASCRERV